MNRYEEDNRHVKMTDHKDVVASCRRIKKLLKQVKSAAKSCGLKVPEDSSGTFVLKSF